MQSPSRLYLNTVLVAVCFFGPNLHASTKTASSASSLEIHAGIAILVDPAEDPAIQAAVADLNRDLGKVLGQKSEIVSTVGANLPAIVVTCKGASTKSYRDETLTADESYSIRQTAGEPLRIVLQGADIRGTIYSIYEFSDRALGVPPLWFWSGWQPHPKPTIVLLPTTFRRVREPSVRWRGWFPNDTDMLEPWLRDSPAHVDLFLETLLRLRFNVLDVDHLSNWDNKPNMGLILARGCRGRGIRVTFTHLAPFGFLLGDWSQYWTTVKHVPPPPKTLTNLDALDEFWTYAIHFVQNEHLDPIQSIEFRVDGDKPFWRDFPDAPADPAQRAQVITFMLKHQLQLLHKVTHDQMPLTRTVFYNEVGEFLDEGKLNPPTDPRLIWNFASEQRDHFPRPEIFEPHPSQLDFGYYFNLQFFTTGSHVVSGEGPWKTEQNLRMVSEAIKPGRLNLVMLNIGNLREFTMETSVASTMLWDADSNADAALTEFAARYFGTAATDVHDVYRAYYNAYWQQKHSDLKNFNRQYIFHDLRYARAGENLLARIATKRYTQEPLFTDSHMLRIVPGENGTSDEVHAIVKGTNASAHRFQAAVEASEKIRAGLPAEDAPFFQETVTADAQFMLAANLFLNEIAEAYISVEHPGLAKQHLAAATTHLAELQTAVDSRERTYLPNWYEHETKFNLQGMAGRLEHARSSLSQATADGYSTSIQ